MDYRQTVKAILELVDRQVILVVLRPKWCPSDRPYRGLLRRHDAEDAEDRIRLAVQEPRDDRWVNPEGVAFGILRSHFVAGRRFGGPAALGVSWRSGVTRFLLLPMTESAGATPIALGVVSADWEPPVGRRSHCRFRTRRRP